MKVGKWCRGELKSSIVKQSTEMPTSKQMRVGHPPPNIRGSFLYTDKFGNWNTIPGFPKDLVIVSDEGYVRAKPRADRPMGRPFKPQQHPEGYRTFIIQSNSYRLAIVVLWAFVGGPPSDAHTADHIAKLDDFMLERGDDRLCNLRWSNKAEQTKNRHKISNPVTSMPVYAFECELVNGKYEPIKNTIPLRFPSMTKASEILGLAQGNIGNCLARRRKSKSSASFRSTRTTGGWFFQFENQVDAEDRSDELWTTLSATLKLSSHGRIEFNSRVYTARPTRGRLYATVRVDKKLEYVHHLVWKNFGHRPLEANETVDHIDSTQKWNNKLTNLRPATKKEQSENQVRRGVKRGFE